MADLINRQKVLSLPRLTHKTLSGEIVAEYISVADIEALPSAEPEITRCKDCKHLYKDGECPLRTWYTHLEEDFCSRAERRTDD